MDIYSSRGTVRNKTVAVLPVHLPAHVYDTGGVVSGSRASSSVRPSRVAGERASARVSPDGPAASACAAASSCHVNGVIASSALHYARSVGGTAGTDTAAELRLHTRYTSVPEMSRSAMFASPSSSSAFTAPAAAAADVVGTAATAPPPLPPRPRSLTKPRLDAAQLRFCPLDHWVPDAHVVNCMAPDCGVSFSLFVRKHHCKMCGRIYCSTCCSNAITVPVTLPLVSATGNNSSSGSGGAAAGYNGASVVAAAAAPPPVSLTNGGYSRNNSSTRARGVIAASAGANRSSCAMPVGDGVGSRDVAVGDASAANGRCRAAAATALSSSTREADEAQQQQQRQLDDEAATDHTTTDPLCVDGDVATSTRVTDDDDDNSNNNNTSCMPSASSPTTTTTDGVAPSLSLAAPASLLTVNSSSSSSSNVGTAATTSSVMTTMATAATTATTTTTMATTVHVCNACYYETQLVVSSRDDTGERRRKRRGELKMFQRGLVVNILAFLPLADLAEVALVSSDFYFLSRDNVIWYQYNVRRWLLDKEHATTLPSSLARAGRAVMRTDNSYNYSSSNNNSSSGSGATSNDSLGAAATLFGLVVGSGGGSADVHDGNATAMTTTTTAAAPSARNGGGVAVDASSLGATPAAAAVEAATAAAAAPVITADAVDASALLGSGACSSSSNNNVSSSSGSSLAFQTAAVLHDATALRESEAAKRVISMHSRYNFTQFLDFARRLEMARCEGLSSFFIGTRLLFANAVRIALIGPSHIGKTASVRVFCGDDAATMTVHATIGFTRYATTVRLVGGVATEVTLVLYDVSGAARYESLRRLICRYCHAVALCYDPAHKVTLVEAANMMLGIEDVLGPQPVVICGLLRPHSRRGHRGVAANVARSSSHDGGNGGKHKGSSGGGGGGGSSSGGGDGADASCSTLALPAAATTATTTTTADATGSDGRAYASPSSPPHDKRKLWLAASPAVAWEEASGRTAASPATAPSSPLQTSSPLLPLQQQQQQGMLYDSSHHHQHHHHHHGRASAVAHSAMRPRASLPTAAAAAAGNAAAATTTRLEVTARDAADITVREGGSLQCPLLEPAPLYTQLLQALLDRLAQATMATTTASLADFDDVHEHNGGGSGERGGSAGVTARMHTTTHDAESSSSGSVVSRVRRATPRHWRPAKVRMAIAEQLLNLTMQPSPLDVLLDCK